jgi:hypothetical protein
VEHVVLPVRVRLEMVKTMQVTFVRFVTFESLVGAAKVHGAVALVAWKLVNRTVLVLL